MFKSPPEQEPTCILALGRCILNMDAKPSDQTRLEDRYSLIEE